MAVPDAILADAFHRVLKEVCFAEKLAARVHGQAARSTKLAELREAMRAEQAACARRVQRLGRVFGMIGKATKSGPCIPMRDLAEEIQTYLRGKRNTAGTDAVLLCWTQHVDAYRAGRYGNLKDWSGKLDMQAAEEEFEAVLQDVGDASARLARVSYDVAA